MMDRSCRSTTRSIWSVRRVPAVFRICWSDSFSASYWLEAGSFPVTGGARSVSRRRGATLLPLLCYEIVFPGEAVPRGEASGMDAELDQRRLVRHRRPAPTRTTPIRRRCGRSRKDSGGRARRQHRHLRGDRSARTVAGRCRWAPRACWTRLGGAYLLREPRPYERVESVRPRRRCARARPRARAAGGSSARRAPRRDLRLSVATLTACAPTARRRWRGSSVAPRRPSTSMSV